MEKLDQLFERLNSVILGNPIATKLSVVCLLARGHLLLEDIPGVGKTTLSHALADCFGLPFKRIQFTSDLLPTDVIGMTIFDMDSKKFQFKRGPLFTSMLLADEINRATPKTQSALLQAMEEKNVSVEGNQIALNDPFFVIATQNPLEQSGTFPLPESQLDRFLMCLSLGYPSPENERLLLSKQLKRESQKAIFTDQEVSVLINKVDDIFVSEAIVQYLQDLLQATRESSAFVTGLSPRAGLQWLQASKALALVEGRDSVIPEDIKLIAPYTSLHRLQTSDGGNAKEELENILNRTAIH